MLPSLLCAVLTTAAPSTPRALPSAEVVVHLPRISAAGGVVDFLGAAGRRTALLRPEAWIQDLHPLLSLRPGRLDDFREAGLDVESAMTVSLRGNDRLTCSGLSDLAKFEAKVKSALEASGTPTSRKRGGAQLTWVGEAGRAPVGYAVQGKQVCAFSSAANHDRILGEAAKAVAAPTNDAAFKRVRALPGPVQLVTPRGVAAMESDGLTLRATALAALDVPAVRAVETPFAGHPASGVAFARGHVESSGRKQWLARMLEAAIDACDGCKLDANRLATVLDRHLTGNFIARVDSVNVAGSLKTHAARYSAVKHAVLFELKDPAALRKALDEVASSARGTTQVESELSFPAGASTVRLGVNPRWVYLSNDAAALEALTKVEPRRGRLAHGIEYAVDAKLANRALAQVSLMDVLSSQELAAIFAAASEVGPLLRDTKVISGWVDSEKSGGHRSYLEWTLASP